MIFHETQLSVDQFGQNFESVYKSFEVNLEEFVLELDVDNDCDLIK